MTDGELILAAASTIVPAIRLAILECASQHGLNDAVRDAYGEVVRYDVVRSALTMDWAPVEPKEDVDAESTIVFQFDVDKVAFVYLDSVWDPEGIAGTALQDRINANDASEEWRGFQALHLVVIEFVVDACFQLPQSAVPSSTVVSISSDELVIFSGLNQSDQIALWKVARSIHSEERQLRSIMGEGFLDSYSIYDTNKKSFYVSDEGRPDAIWAMATGVLCRRKHLARCDRHFAPCRASRTWRGGTKLHSRPNEPIYVAEDSSPANVHLLAEVGRCYIWVASRSEVGCRLPPVLLGEFLAFWAWQMIPDVAANSSSEFNMRIDAVVTRESQMCPVCGDSVSSFHFCFRPDRVNFFTSEDWLSRLLETVDNTGERQILVELLPAILSALKHEIDVDAVHEIVDRCAPVGNKRKLVTVRGGDAQIISLEGLPRIRTIDDFDLGVNADAIGSHAQANWSDKTTEAYNAIVEFLFHQFRDVVDNWSSDHCLETLMLQHERLVAERKQLETQIPCTIACYGADEDHVLHLRNMLGDIDRASIASRFLIEYTAAVPPSGGAELSLSGYDRALALALDIATYGMQSDSVQYGVSTRSLRILGSGRLSQLDEHYDNVAAKFSHSTFRSKFLLIQKADLPSIEEESRDDPKMFDKLEAATRQEYGIELTNLLRLFGFIANSPFTQESGFGNARTAELIGYLSTELNMPEDQLHSVLARITLRRRKSFLRPPSPFRAVDVYPWRFNRELSYLRRPLIVHEHNGEPMLCWGMRAVVQAASYWVTLCTEGRMKNLSTNAMKSLQGEIANARGHAFNRHVANLVRQREGISSRANVTRLKSKRVEDIDGHDLGDIDVLAVQLRSRKVYVIEVKSFSAAKTPVEMANERDKLFGEESEENGAVRKHLRRVQWIRDNLDTVIDDMAGDQLEASIWTVVPVIVIDEDLFMSHLIADAIQVVTLEAFLRILDRNTGH
ncbi:MAG: hypothetical protein H6824_03655 [Planctomycetaceae bacterium]|nr:hypothetical protein [Planctomycetaceae bacterium]